MKILVVEDDFISRKVITTILQDFGTVDIATNGLEAKEAVTLACAQKVPYDLICLDILMPEMNGHEVLQQIRDDEEKAGIPYAQGVKIIMTTALSDTTNLMTAYNNLCDGYITKPIERDAIIKVLHDLELID